MPRPLNAGVGRVVGTLAATSVAVVFALVVPAGCERAPAKPPQVLAAVSVANPVEREVLDWDEFTGTLAAIPNVELRARVSGFIVKDHFAEGKVVDEGQILFELDPASYEAEVGRATGQLQQAVAHAENMKAEFKRIDDLRKQGGSSDKEWQDAKFNQQQAEAAVTTAKAAEDLAKLNLDYTKVRSPIRGRVSDKFVTVGNLINGGSGAAQATLLTRVVNVDPIYCYVDADERSVQKYAQLAREKKRISARDEPIPCFMRLQTDDDFAHEGFVDFVDNHVNPGTGTLRARARFANPDGAMLPGYFARIRVPGSGRYRALLVPDAAIDTNQSIRFLRVLKADDTVEFRTVRIGSKFGAFRVVEQGITAADRVVVNGLQRAIPGNKVQPTAVPLDLSGIKLTAPGSPTTRSLPATRLTDGQTVPLSAATRAISATQPATGPAAQPAR